MKRILLVPFALVSFASARPLVFEGTEGPSKGRLFDIDPEGNIAAGCAAA